ncbi:MAG: hypothetical protein KGJ13_00685 [Patescibacteria group bacterium]|nr:hypothetical protein [Patescibacteria group bacterium]
MLTPATIALSVPKPPTGAIPQGPFQTVGGLAGAVCDLIPWIFWGLIIASIVVALVAAYKYLTSAGDPDKVGDASKTLLYAAVGVVVALLAAGMPYIVNSFISGSGGLTQSACSGGCGPQGCFDSNGNYIGE